METNKNKVLDHIQDLGALIALVALVVGHQYCEP